MKLEPESGQPDRSALRDPQSLILDISRQLAALTVWSQRADVIMVLNKLFCPVCGRLRDYENIVSQRSELMCSHWAMQPPVQGYKNLINYADSRERQLSEYAVAVRNSL